MEWERALTEQLDTQTVGRPLLAFNEIVSTNDVAKQMAENRGPDGLAIIARNQTGGRGRRGRDWVSFPGRAVCLSIVVRPPWKADNTSILGVLGGVAAADALASAGVPGLSIKWPNDVLASGRKIAGVLVEPRLGEGMLTFAVIGVGINVAQTESDWPDSLRTIATSCAMEGRSVAPDEVALLLLSRLDEWYLRLRDGGHAMMMEAWARWTGSDRLPVLD